MNLELGADSFDELLQAIKNLHLELLIQKDKGSNFEGPYNSVSGGPSSGYSLSIEFNSEMTHEKYFEEVNAFLAKGEKIG